MDREVDEADRELTAAQDEFYSCMTKWIVSRRDGKGGRECYELALKYDDAIDRYIACLAKETPTTYAVRAREVADKWKSFLSTDLEYLSKFHLIRPTQNAPNPTEQRAR